MSDSIILQLNQLGYQVPSEQGQLTILKDCDLTVQSEQSLAIIGRSGSGKSTLLSLMAGLALPTSGEVRLFGQNLSRLSEDERAQLRAKQVGFVFQNFQLMPNMTALENVLMPLELFGFDQAYERATVALERVELANRLTHRPAELSGGEQQRVALARAFVTEPKLLFADEPTGNLDEQTAGHVQQLLFSLQQTFATTLVLVTHDRQFAQTCQTQVELKSAQLVVSA